MFDLESDTWKLIHRRVNLLVSSVVLMFVNQYIKIRKQDEEIDAWMLFEYNNYIHQLNSKIIVRIYFHGVFTILDGGMNW